MLGAGVIGVSIALALRERGPERVIVVEPSEVRRERVTALGLGRAVAPDRVGAELARFQPGGADVVFEATGSAPVLGGAHEIVRPGGQIVVVGQSGDSFSLPMIVMTRKELSLIGTRNSANQFPHAIDLLDRHPEFAASVITDRVPGAQRRRGVREADGARDAGIQGAADRVSAGLAIVVGASQGLGLDVARSLHGDGWNVVTLSRGAPAATPPWEHELVDAADADTGRGVLRTLVGALRQSATCSSTSPAPATTRRSPTPIPRPGARASTRASSRRI